MALDLEAIMARQAARGHVATAAVRSAADVPALVAEVEELRADLRIANEATLLLLSRVAAAEAAGERLRRVERAARKVHSTNGHYPTHLGGCIGVLSSTECPCGIGDLSFAVMALDQKVTDG